MSLEPLDPHGRADQIDAARDRALRAMLERVARLHPYYRGRLGVERLRKAADAGLEDFDAFPVTTKDDFLADPAAFVLEHDPKAPDEHLEWDHAYTGGTSTGRRARLTQTAYDFRAILFAQQRMADIRGMGPSDTIMNLFPMTPQPHGAWLRCNHAAAQLGAAVVNGLSGSAQMGFPVGRRFDEIVDLTAASAPTVLWGVPTYVRKVLRALRDAGQPLPSLWLIAISGEPCGPALRADLEGLGAELAGRTVTVSDSMGASELQCGLVECRPGGGFHNPAPELFLLETLDDDGGQVPVGEEGALALTHLDRRGTVLLRYLLGDHVVLSRQRCEHCGRLGERIVAHRGRSGSRTKVRGNLVDLDAAARGLEELERVHEYEIRVLGPDGTRDLDEVHVSFETDDGSEAQVERITQRLHELLGIRPIVRAVPRGTLYEARQLKPRRVVDERVTTAPEEGSNR